MAYKRLGDLLLAAEAITPEELDKALSLQKGTGKRLGDVLLEHGFITEATLINALSEQLGVDFVDLSKVNLEPELAKLLPKSVARKYDIVPLKVTAGEIYIVMVDPLNFPAIEDVKKITGRKVIPMISTATAVDRAIMTLYGNEGAVRAIEELKKTATDAELSHSVTQEDVSSSENSAPTIRLVNSIIERAITEQASDIHLESRENDMLVRVRVDGVLRNILTVPKNLEAGVIARLKVMGDMDTSERKKPQDGRANVISRKKSMDLRISTLPTIYGEKMVIRLLDKSGAFLSRGGIGLDPYNEERFNELLLAKSGVILISGPPGSGKSSTMNTIVRELNTEEVNIVTLEDPVEYNTEGVNQVQINDATGMTFANGLRSILRQDPDIISVGEIRDGETAEIAMRAAITGHLVFSTIHTGDSVSTIDRLYDIGVPTYLTASALKGVIAQRLVRKICPVCKEEYEPTDEELELLGMKRAEKMRFARGKGCPTCFHTGFKGRTAVFEIMLTDSNLRKSINGHATHEQMVEEARANGMRSIADRCRELVETGVTTVGEAAKTIFSTLE